MGARKSNDKSILVPDVRDALERMKYETAEELNINEPDKEDWGDVTSTDCRRVGGIMTMTEADPNSRKSQGHALRKSQKSL